MERGAHRVLDAAYAGGVRYFDAARSYGLAESFLASWLASRQIQPGAVVVGSKWGYRYTADWRVDAEAHEVKEHSLAMFTRQLAESRAILGSHLAVYQIHSATLDSGVLSDSGIIDALAEARSTGLVIGLSVSGDRQAETIWRGARPHSRWRASVRYRTGDVEPAGARSGACARGGARHGPCGHREGGAGERTTRGAIGGQGRARYGARCVKRNGSTSRQTCSPSRRRSRSRGRPSC